MKVIKRIILAIPVLLSIVIVAVLLFIGSLRKAAIPVYDGTLTLRGLDEEVMAHFDERGMPHIYAGTEKDLYYATGFLMARERLWQMDIIRRATRGTLSEIFGKDYVETDLFLRSLCMTEKSKIILANSAPEIILMIEYFCDGVNRYITDAGRKLPPEFRILRYRPEPWTPEDVTNIIGYMGWDLASGTLAEDLFNYRLFSKLGDAGAEKIIPDWRATRSYVYPDFSIDEALLKEAQIFVSGSERLAPLGIFSFSGSNNWALTGTRTTTGKPLLSNDMHLGLSTPGIWMQMHQVVRGRLNVTGVAVPGQPFIVAGHNENIAWGLTNLMVDDIDLFLEKTDTSMPGSYFFNGNWMEMERREEIIKIKGGDEEHRTLLFTHRGPVISGMRNIDGAVITMRWSGYDLSDEIYTVYHLNRASSWDQFRDAISRFRSISQNFVYADTAGNIGLNTGGGVPVRKGHGTIIRDGSTDEYDWLGYVPFEQLPFSYNPPEGYVSSANNKTVPDDYPWYIATSYALPYRINRIREMLESKEIFSPDDLKEMVTDQKSNYAAILAPVVVQSLSEVTLTDENEKKAARLLREWDFVMSADQEAPALFEFFRRAFARELIADELGELFGSLPSTYSDYYIYRIIMTGPDKWVDRTATAEYENMDVIIRMAFRSAVKEIVSYTGERGLSSWKWGDIHKMVLEHPLGSVALLDRLLRLNSPEYRTGGSNHTVSPYSYSAGFMVNHGASQKHIYNTADWDDSWSIIPTGNSGVPGSPYYLSQTDSYVEGKIYRDHFTERAVRENAAHSLSLQPSR
ncbi:MAG: penicillin acylase family protein [Bacteroidales bacterium]|jgi:penicillin amidase|nr:penicillin acylase family protein [Bacteroidales bacterium]